MRIVREKFLATYREPGHCEICGTFCTMLCGAHIVPRSRHRMDVSINLVRTAIHPHGLCQCHVRQHSGKGITEAGMMAIVAVREGVSVHAVDLALTVLSQIPTKYPTEWDFRVRIDELVYSGEIDASRLLENALKEAGKL